MQEIGKRSIWTPRRAAASARAAVYHVISIDGDMAARPAWMHGLLTLICERSEAAQLTGLPVQTFDLEAQHALAFRALQRGLNVGKVVVSISPQCGFGAHGTHIVTGGTGGLGLLTGRWLAQQHVRHLVLVSRGGAIARDMLTEWDAMLL